MMAQLVRGLLRWKNPWFMSDHLSHKESPFTSLRVQDTDSVSPHQSIIVIHDYGILYPIPQSMKSSQILAFIAQILLINTRVFAGQVRLHLHPACDTVFHLKMLSSSCPFQMKLVVENIAFWSTHLLLPSLNYLIYRLIVSTRLWHMLHLKVIDYVMQQNMMVNLLNLLWSYQGIHYISVLSL